jgi:hypothetical protein
MLKKVHQININCNNGVSISGQLLEQLHDRLSILVKENKQLVERVDIPKVSVKYKKE